MQLGGRADFLCPIIWSRDAISRCLRQWVRIKFCENLGKSATETLAVIRQAYGEESMSRTRVFEWHAWFRADQKGWDKWRAKSRTCSLFYLTSRGGFHKEFMLAGHTVNSTYYCDSWQRLWNCAHSLSWTLATNELAVASQQHTVTHFLFHQGFFFQKTTWLSSRTHPTFICVPN
jgi:hypothetical protein